MATLLREWFGRHFSPIHHSPMLNVFTALGVWAHFLREMEVLLSVIHPEQVSLKRNIQTSGSVCFGGPDSTNNWHWQGGGVLCSVMRLRPVLTDQKKGHQHGCRQENNLECPGGWPLSWCQYYALGWNLLSPQNTYDIHWWNSQCLVIHKQYSWTCDHPIPASSSGNPFFTRRIKLVPIRPD